MHVMLLFAMIYHTWLVAGCSDVILASSSDSEFDGFFLMICQLKKYLRVISLGDRLDDTIGRSKQLINCFLAIYNVTHCNNNSLTLYFMLQLPT